MRRFGRVRLVVLRPRLLPDHRRQPAGGHRRSVLGGVEQVARADAGYGPRVEIHQVGVVEAAVGQQLDVPKLVP